MKNFSSRGPLRWLTRPLAMLGLLLTTASATQAQTAPTFAPVALYNMGGNPVGPQLVDINGDGFRDLLTANFNNSTLGVRLGTGTGTLGALATFPCGGQPLGLAVGDLNNDNKLDVVLANYFGSQVSVLLGNGSGGFGAATQFATGSQPYGVALGDFNGDGKLDAVTADYGSGKVGVLLGTGTGAFGAATEYAVGGAPDAVAVGDVSGNGQLDVLVSIDNGSVGVLLGNGTGRLGTATVYSLGTGDARGVALGDLNRDGRPDIVAAGNATAPVAVLLNIGAGAFGAASRYAGSGSGDAIGVALGDLNGDGFLDVAVARNGRSAVDVWPGTGTGTLGTATALTTDTSSPQDVAIGDLNNDGKPDLVAGEGNSSGSQLNAKVFLNTTVFTAPTLTSISPNPAAVGTSVTLTGTSLNGATAVRFNNTAATTFAVVNGTNITATVPTGATTGLVTVTTPGGTSNGVVFTVLQPATTVASINRVSSSPTNAGSVSFTVTFAAAVTGVSASNFALATTGLAGASITGVSGSGTTYTVAVSTGTGDGTLGLNLANATGLNASVSNVPFAGQVYTIDKTAPTFVITSPTAPNGGYTTTTPIPLVVTFSEDIANPGLNTGAGFSYVTNSSTGTYIARVGRVTTYNVQPAGAGAVILTIPANAVTDLAGNSNAGPIAYTIFYNVPTAAPVLTSPAPNAFATSRPTYTGTAPAGSTITLYLASGGGAAQAIGTTTATGGTFSLTPTTALPDGTYAVYATAQASGQAVSANSNTNTFVVDTTPPTVTLASSASNPTTNPIIPFSATFSEAVTGFSASSIAVTNGTIVGVGNVGNIYYFTVQANAMGPVMASIAAGAAQDAAGNNSLAAGPFSVTYALPMSVAPVLLNPTNGITTRSPIIIGGSAPTGSFVGITVTNLSNGGTSYRSTSATNNNFSSQFNLPSGTYQAVATAQQSGRQPADSAPITFTIDATAPTAVVSTTAGSPTSTAPIPVTVTFSEPITGFSAGSVSVTNGTVTSAITNVGNDYSFSVTPTANGTVTVRVPDNAVRDAVGNYNVASNTLSVSYAAPITATTWTGTVSTDWYTAGNWTQGVPTATVDAIIAAGTPFAPLIAAGTASAQSLTLSSGAALNQRGGTLVVGGTVANGGTITSTGGALVAGGAVTNSGTITNTGGDLTTGGSFTSTGTVTGSGGTFTVGGSFANSGAGATLRLNSGSTLNLGGNFINTGGTVDGSGTGRLALTGTVVQAVGGTLSTFPNLTVGTAGAFTTGPARIRSTGDLTLNGNLSVGAGQAFTLLSDASGTAFVVNTNGTVTGTATVQRYIDPSVNPGLGYRHYSAPVSNSTVADLTTSGFTPVVNPAYNTSATPTLVQPFPTVFGYDDNRLSLANNLSAFDKGFFSPATLTDPLAVGRGYTVNISASELVDFQGTLNNGDLTLALPSTRNTYPDGGWQLLGNPYPAPLDYSRVAAADRQGMEGAIYIYSSTSQYAGRYRVYVNGIGTPVLPVGQAFFARVATGLSSASMTFRNSQRRVTPDGTTFQRPTAPTDARPLVQLELRAAGSPTAADEFFAYAESGASPAFESQYDAEKVPNPTGFNLAGTAASGEALAIDGRAAFTAATVLPLTVGVPAAGTYALSAATLANLPTGLDAYLADALTGQLLKLSPGTSYSFSVTAAQATALLSGRFRLIFHPATALATVPSLTAEAVSVYPNPAHARFTVLLPGLAQATTVQAELLNALGQVVRRQQAALPAGGTQLTFDTAELATGVYTLRLQAGATTLAKRVVVE